MTGSVERSADGGASIDPEDAIDGATVSGNVVNWLDSYRFDGEIEKSRSLGTVTSEDVVDGQSVSGYVDGAKDGYRYSGDSTWLQLEGSAKVSFEDTVG